jgi:N-acetylglucosaminyldiphosphoundecaprenol N-acetyl-beta-D-mannosaminyltransferase
MMQRNVHWILGLPFDAVTLDQAVAHIRTCAFNGERCFFSTPNLNFLITAQSNEAFRQSVIHSDLSLADGMPIVWLAKLMSVPIKFRVAGSDVFEALRHSEGRPLKIYFYGGPPSVAQRAMKVINAEQSGLHCVGYESPGFGSVQELSSAETLRKINQSGAEFLVVSLGAVKGQAWIEHNLPQLNVPVVSHLGAVVNFVAGNVKRAPSWMRNSGLEWAWRIKEEPALFKRYAYDGLGLLRLTITKVVPHYFSKKNS